MDWIKIKPYLIFTSILILIFYNKYLQAIGVEDSSSEELATEEMYIDNTKKISDKFIILTPPFIIYSKNKTARYRNAKIEVALFSKDPNMVEALKVHQEQIYSQLKSLLESKNISDIKGPEAQNKLRVEIFNIIITLLGTLRQESDIRVMFTNYVMQ